MRRLTLTLALMGATVLMLGSGFPKQGTDRRPTCGICLAHSWHEGGAGGYGTEPSRRTLRDLRGIGIGTVSLTPFGWMAGVDDPEVKWAGPWSQTKGFPRLRKEAAAAKTLGLTVMLKPHIWIRGGAWRGDIAPDPENGGWKRWFDSYEAFLLPHAELAAEVGADWFSIGVELSSAIEARPQRFRRLIAEVRKRYSGKITYGANWDRADRVPFWGELDAVGVQMFAPLIGSGEVPTAAALRAGAQRWLERYVGVARRHRKPLILTEAGYTNIEGMASQPWIWPERADGGRTPAGDREQADAYRAILSTFGVSPEVEAVYWWKWFSHPETGEDSPVGFSPKGKPAYEVLRTACNGELG